MSEKTLVMVLGMHRSGTSVITKGLETLGISLSENILPVSKSNKKGYWEDLDILAINEKLLHYAGLEWYSPDQFPVTILDEPFCQALIDEAAILLNRKISEQALWGFKEPRSSRLLPFWLRVFKRAEITPKFLLSIRNPLDVANSLKSRNDFEHLHSYYLWLLHVLPNIDLLIKFDYAIVDFSSLLKMPEKCMHYISERLKLKVNNKVLSEFIQDHLDASLCHSSSEISDLVAHENSFDLLINTYKTLLSVSLDVEGVNDFDINNTFPNLVNEFDKKYDDCLSSLLTCSYKRYFNLLHEKNVLAKSHNELIDIKLHLESEKQNLESEKQNLESEKQSLIGNITKSEKRAFEASNELNAQLNLIFKSTSWKLTMPIRTISRIVRGDWAEVQAGLNHRLPLLSHAFNPIAGGFSARSMRGLSLLFKQGPKAFLRRLKLVNQTIKIGSLPFFESEKNKLVKLFPKMSKPLISVVMTTYNTDEEFLRLCIDSVINQSYSNWELCIADDASVEPQVRKVLEEYRAKDKRIKVIYRKMNGHISAATNSALGLVTGNWVALLDHDDELHSDALLFVVHAINDNKSVEFIYSDEDKIDQQGLRTGAHFKSDWNLDLLYSQNYVSHLGVYKTDIVKKIGGFRVGYEGSQDFDLLLRYSREIDHKNVTHIPHILYHWRMVEGSTALASGEKSYTTEAGIKALKDHFKALGKGVLVEQGKFHNTYKVNWQLQDEPLVSLIIPTHNGYEITKQAIDSILQKTIYVNYEILLVDNNSDDPTALAYFEDLAKLDNVSVLRYPYPFNYSAVNNFAVKQAKGDIIGLINNDVEVINAEWLTEMVSHAQREDIGCVGAKLYYSNDTIQHAGVIIGLGGVAGHSHKYFEKDHPGYFGRLHLVQNFSAVTAACLLVKKSIFDEVSGLNEQDLKVAFNDVDFCLKVQSAGYRNLWTPYAELYHYESISRGAEDNPEKIARFNKEIDYMVTNWKTNEISDFAYNSNLTVIKEDFSLA